MNRSSLAELLRVDLIKRHWPIYTGVCVLTIAIHVLWMARFGISPSTDYGVRYEPGAKALLAMLHIWPASGAAASAIGAYGWSRIGYISFVALCYAMAGTASLAAVIYTQVAIVWIVYPLIFHLLLLLTRRLELSLGAMAVWFTYYDGYQWHFWAVPDALYRLMFLVSFFLLLRLWQLKRETAFVVVTIVATVACTLMRIETPLYALPALWLSAVVLYRRYGTPSRAGLVVVAFAGVLWLARHYIGALGSTFVYLQTMGFVLPGSGYDVPGLTQLSAPAGHSLGDWTLFFAHLAAARFWYAVTPLPALWGHAHRLYYACYILPGYLLASCGLVVALRQRNGVFMTCAWIFAAGILLQVLVAVDPSMRYAYTPQVFLFFCAAMGWPAFARLVAGGRGSVARAATTDL
jgi:hypothetical protein